MNYSLLLSIIYAFPVIVMGQLVGSQHDDHNCVTDGGYQWCESTQSCIRPWVTPCHSIVIDPSPVPTTTQYCPQSQMQLCRMMCPTPHCPSGECAMRTGSCCDYVCHVPDNHRRSQSIPQNCATWFDGCNTCQVDTSGRLGACTMMMCFTNGTPECRTYHVVNSQLPISLPSQLPVNQLNIGDVCYRFCEDSSESFINRANDCPSGSRCVAPTTSTSTILFDSCHSGHWTCEPIAGH
jgi:hypothetical protein